MKTTVRPQSFETNSSSQHAIVFSKDYDMSRASGICTVEGGEYGWDYNTYTSPSDKLNYLWTAINSVYYQDALAIEAWKEFLVRELVLPGDVKFKAMSAGYDGWDDNPYIDHADEMEGLLSDMLENPEILRAYAFGEGYIETGNDNDGWPEGHMMKSPEFDGGWDDEKDEWIPPAVPWGKVGEWHGKWIYLKGN